MRSEASLFWAKLGENKDGRLTARLIFDETRKFPESQALLQIYKTLSESSGQFAESLRCHPPKEIFAGGSLAALACSEARAGDIIGRSIHGHSFSTSHLALVYRSKSPASNLYDIIGQALLVNGHRFDETISRRPEPSRVDRVIRVDHSAEDALILCGQDVVSFDPFVVDPLKQLLRLVTLPIAQPFGAGRMMAHYEQSKTYHRSQVRKANVARQRSAHCLDGLSLIFDNQAQA